MVFVQDHQALLLSAADKSSADYSTTIPVYTHGIFDLKTAAGIAITAGMQLRTSGANMVAPAQAADLLVGAVVGKALETADTDGETIAVLVGKN